MTPLDSLDDRSAEAVCAECGQTVPREDTQVVAGKTVCNRCVEAIRARVMAEMNSAAPTLPAADSTPAATAAPAQQYDLGDDADGRTVSAPLPPAAMGPAAPPGVGQVGSWSASQQQPAPTAVGPQKPLGVGRALAGFALGSVLALVGVAVWVLIVVLIKGWNLSLFAIGLGWLIGFGVLKGCGRGGTIPAVMGGTLALGATLLGSFLLSNGSLGLFGWFCVAVGTYEGFAVPRRGS